MGHESAPTIFPRSLTGLRVDGITPDPAQIARRLAPLGDVVALVSAAPNEGQPRYSFVSAAPNERSEALVPAGRVDLGARHFDDEISIPEWVGLIPYESSRSLEREGWRRPNEDRAPPHHESPTWRRYPSVLVIDHLHNTLTCVGDDRAHMDALVAAARSTPPHLELPGQLRMELIDDDLRDHADRISEVLRLISQGDLYQVNVARRLTLQVKGEPLDLFIKTMNNSPTSHCGYIDFDNTQCLSTSPEIFLDARRTGAVVTRPIKGTRPRGSNAASDERLRRELDADEKERAELAMVVDLERNDLGRVAVAGTVRVDQPPRIETHATLHHRVADVVASLPDRTTWEELVRATFPSGSVTGTPKVRAMEVISRIERHRRGLYTGAIGYVGRDGRLLLSMAIRTLTLRDGEGHYHVGGGIVADSNPAREVEETRVKTLHLTRVLEELVSER